MPVHDVLLKLQRRRLDEVRSALRDAVLRLQAAEARREGWRERIACEGQTVAKDPELTPWLAAYQEAARLEGAALHRRLGELRQEQQEKARSVLHERMECRRLELLAERAQRRAARKQARVQERKLGDQLLHFRIGR